MSKTRLVNILIFILGILTLIGLTPLGFYLIEVNGKGEFTYLKGMGAMLGVVLIVSSMFFGVYLSAISLIAFNRNKKFSDV